MFDTAGFLSKLCHYTLNVHVVPSTRMPSLRAQTTLHLTRVYSLRLDRRCAEDLVALRHRHAKPLSNHYLLHTCVDEGFVLVPFQAEVGLFCYWRNRCNTRFRLGVTPSQSNRQPQRTDRKDHNLTCAAISGLHRRYRTGQTAACDTCSLLYLPYQWLFRPS